MNCQKSSKYEQWDIIQLILQNYPEVDLDFSPDTASMGYYCKRLISKDLFGKILNHYIIFNKGIINRRSKFILFFGLESVFIDVQERFLPYSNPVLVHDTNIKYIHYHILLRKPFFSSDNSIMEVYNQHKNNLLNSLNSAAMFLINNSLPKEISDSIALQSLYDQLPHLKVIPEFFLLKILERQKDIMIINLNKMLINKIAKESFERLISINNVLIISSPEQREVSMKLISRQLEKYPIETIRTFSFRIVKEIGKNQGLPFPILNKDLINTAIRKVLSSESVTPLCSSRIDETITALDDALDQNSRYFA